ncbi:unnamed protein product [Urochloa decumbens]|uniref:DUF4220 domain-containing protein n=1 Tax=Urochloa decumbens TaxID=240449 RepID=A0ABC9GBA2_9POAL
MDSCCQMPSLMGIVVGVGVYAPRYRRHPVIGVLFVGATTLFLPIVSEVASTVGGVRLVIASLLGSQVSNVECKQVTHLVIVLIWTGTVVVIGISAIIVVAADGREGRNIDPPIILLIKAIWSVYLTVSTLLPAEPHVVIIFIQLFVIMFTKLVFKYSTFYKAKTSFAFGRSPRLIAGYMAQPQQLSGVNPSMPALLVMGEDSVQVERQPHGYSFKEMPDQGDMTRLVTLDKVWRLHDIGILPSSTARTEPRDVMKHKDLCFSFALFKMLRCRFAKYTALEAGFMKTHRFFRNTLLQGADDYERVFRVIEDELSFVHDYYCSCLPIYYSHHLLPVLSIALSLYSIGYCLYLILFFSYHRPVPLGYGQIVCWVPCIENSGNSKTKKLRLGALYFDIVSMYLVLAVLVLAETRDIVSFVCSNWTKVSLVYHCINQASWQQSRIMKKCIASVFNLRECKLLNTWDDKMKQCSILELHPRKITLRVRHLLHLRNRKTKIKVPTSVKAAIFDALKGETSLVSCEGELKHIRPPLSPISYSGTDDISSIALSLCDGKRPAYTILAWHVATSVYEVSHSSTSYPEASGHMIAATRLSCYCAYLVGYCPELLPDDAKWCESLYSDVKDCAYRVLYDAPGVEYQQLVQLLRADSNHEVLKDGARLGKQLVDSKTGWEALARFWSEMILYVAPSENLEGHAEAIARGGELITLLWALLAHDGIIGRRSDTDSAAATSDAGRV